jgi:hypothetical protein
VTNLDGICLGHVSVRAQTCGPDVERLHGPGGGGYSHRSAIVFANQGWKLEHKAMSPPEMHRVASGATGSGVTTQQHLLILHDVILCAPPLRMD